MFDNNIDTWGIKIKLTLMINILKYFTLAKSVPNIGNHNFTEKISLK